MSLKIHAPFSAAVLVFSMILFPDSAVAANCIPEITTNGNQTVVAFKTVGTCTWNTPAGLTSFKGLIVAGGGGGGSDLGGGGGGGGYVEFDSLSAASDVFTIVVGAGGAGAPASSTGPAGTSGGNSSITGTGINLTSRGGAGGASTYGSTLYAAQSNGGSGGGASGYLSSGGARSLGTQTSQSQTPSLATINGGQFGFDGSVGGASWYPGGGGGAGSSGVNTPATGGNGRANSILGTSYYWAAGGGGSACSSTAGAGGSGGGGGGGGGCAQPAANAGSGGLNAGGNGTSTSGGAGALNTGSGGGAGGYPSYAGGAGGSGIVVLSYLTFIGNTTISLQLSGGGTAATYRTASTLEAVVGTAGKVTFYQFGKPISGCRNKQTSGSAPNIKATCSWRPSNRGAIQLTALVSPISASYAATRSSIFSVSVANRTIAR